MRTLGPFFDVTNVPINASKSVYTSQFYLVVKRADISWYHYVYTPFITFSAESWVLIALVILIAGCSIDIVQNGISENCLRRNLHFGRFGNILFNSVAQFFGKDGVAPDAQGPEKLILFGFAFFTLVAITYFSSTMTGVVIEDFKLSE